MANDDDIGARAAADEERAGLEIAGRSFDVRAVDGAEAVARLFRFDVLCASVATGPTAASLLGKMARLTLRDTFGAERTITGIVAEAARRVSDDGASDLRVSVRPAQHALTLGRNSRVFQDLDVVGIAREVLPGARFDVVGHYPRRAYCAQYREDDWSFISRLFEEEGLYVWFDHGDASILVVSDASTSAPPLHGGALVPFAFATGKNEPHELVLELATEVTLAPTRFTSRSFDPARVNFPVGGGAGAGPLEVYRAPGGGPESPDVCAARAKVALEAAGATGSRVSGRTSSVRVVPGMTVEIDDHPRDRLNGAYFVAEVTYTLRQADRFAGAAAAYDCRFSGVRSATPFRAPSVTPPARQAGLQYGVVVGPAGAEIHPDPSARVRVQLAWDRGGQRDERAGKWMRVAQRGAAESMLLPRVGWTVLTSNQEGSVDAPTVICRIHDGEHRPTYALPDHKTRTVFKTATSPGGGSHNEIRFEDKDGGEEVLINASRDMNVLVMRIKTDTVHRDNARTIGNDHTLNVMQDFVDRVKLDQTTAIGANETVETAENAAVNVDVDETHVVAGSRTLHTGGAHTTSVKGTRKVAVGAAQIDVTLGAISATAGKVHSTLVGGAVLRVTDKTITQTAGLASAQTIGALKLEVAKKSRRVASGRALFETVGGATMLSAGKKYLDVSAKTMAWSVGAKLSADAPVVTIEAKEKIELKCGTTLVTIEDGGVTISADRLDLTEATDLVATTTTISHNTKG